MPIHPQAIVADAAHVPASCEIGPFCVVGPEVVLGEGCRLIAQVHLEGPTRIGARNIFFPFSTVGVAPQDLTYRNEPTTLEIGDDNQIREFCSIHRGTIKGGGRTTIGHRNLIMAYCHVAHDCHVGNDVIMANGATLGGHVIVEDFASVGAMTPVHQFVRVGRHAYIGGGTIVTQDVLPYSKTSERRENGLFGANRIGLERRGFSNERIDALQRAFRLLLKPGLNTTQALEQIRAGEPSDDVRILLEFIEGGTERGFIK